MISPADASAGALAGNRVRSQHAEGRHASASVPSVTAMSIAPSWTELYEDLHKHPELSFEEQRTAGIVADSVPESGDGVLSSSMSLAVTV